MAMAAPKTMAAAVSTPGGSAAIIAVNSAKKTAATAHKVFNSTTTYRRSPVKTAKRGSGLLRVLRRKSSTSDAVGHRPRSGQ